MKQKNWIIATMLITLFLTGCGGQKISRNEAENIALSHAGLSKDEVTFVRGEKEFEDGRAVYDVEFYTKDFREFDYQIDAKTGEILSFDADMEKDVSQTENKPDAAITEEQAKAIILKKVSGATAENIREFKTHRDDGRMEYEGKIVYNNREYEFEIDAETGEIISWNEESVFD